MAGPSTVSVSTSITDLLRTTKPDTLDSATMSVRHPARIVTRFTTRHVFHTPTPVVSFDPALTAGKRVLVRKAARDERVVTERVTLWDGVVVDRSVVSTSVLRRGAPALVHVAPPASLRDYVALSGYHTLSAVMLTVATAYTAATATANPTGRTATGILAHYGVVAVDPRVIPLGSHLFIPGYGPAIAADTGGAIVGRRIDLCMDSFSQAIRFGRRPVTVYVLKE